MAYPSFLRLKCIVPFALIRLNYLNNIFIRLDEEPHEVKKPAPNSEIATDVEGKLFCILYPTRSWETNNLAQESPLDLFDVPIYQRCYLLRNTFAVNVRRNGAEF